MNKLFSHLQGITIAILVIFTAFECASKTAYAGELDGSLGTSFINIEDEITPKSDTVETQVSQETEAAEQTEAETEEEYVEPVQNNSVMSKGVKVESTIAGHYYAYSIPGLAVITPEYELQKQANFMVLEYFYVTTWDLHPTTSPLAIATLRFVAALQNGDMGPSFQMTVSRLFSGKVTPYENENVKVGTMVQIPDDFKKDNTTYAVMCVRSGGVYEILPDLDDDPSTITFNAHAGTAAYALLRYNEIKTED